MTPNNYSFSVLLELVRVSFKAQMGDLGWSTFLQRLWMEFEKQGSPEFTRDAHGRFHYPQAPLALHDRAIEVFFYLIRNGYAVEKFHGEYVNPPTSQSYRWTDLGNEWIRDTAPVPEDAEGYLKHLQSIVSPLDPVIEQYAAEAVKVFARQAFFAAAVMLGAAAEKSLYLLAEGMLGAHKSAKHRTQLESLLKYRRLLPLLEHLRDSIVLAETSKSMPYALTEGAVSHLMSLFEAIRMQRNDAVHPMNAAVSGSSVRMLLTSFPHALEKAIQIATWLKENSQSI